MRGGTANVTVIVSDDPISSPIVNSYDVAIVLNQPSLDKFELRLKPGGIWIYDSYGVNKKPERKDINVYCINAMDEATKLQNTKVFNMIVLGGLLKISPIVQIDNVMEGLKKSLPERHHKLLPMNEKAILLGMEKIELEQKSV
jgi:2-oxoglutarate ferredoxin oxidoreductase subunit gamma